jgi:hypothetical protein
VGNSWGKSPEARILGLYSVRNLSLHVGIVGIVGFMEIAGFLGTLGIVGIVKIVWDPDDHS